MEFLEGDGWTNDKMIDVRFGGGYSKMARPFCKGDGNLLAHVLCLVRVPSGTTTIDFFWTAHISPESPSNHYSV